MSVLDKLEEWIYGATIGAVVSLLSGVTLALWFREWNPLLAGLAVAFLLEGVALLLASRMIDEIDAVEREQR